MKYLNIDFQKLEKSTEKEIIKDFNSIYGEMKEYFLYTLYCYALEKMNKIEGLDEVRVSCKVQEYNDEGLYEGVYFDYTSESLGFYLLDDINYENYEQYQNRISKTPVLEVFDDEDDEEEEEEKTASKGKSKAKIKAEKLKFMKQMSVLINDLNSFVSDFSFDGEHFCFDTSIFLDSDIVFTKNKEATLKSICGDKFLTMINATKEKTFINQSVQESQKMVKEVAKKTVKRKI